MTTAITRPTAPRVGDAYIDLLPATQAGGEPTRAIVKLGRNGVLKSVKAQLRLDSRKGHTWPISVREGNEWKTRFALTAQAYDYCNQVAGVTFVSPDTVMGDEGRERPNPCIERNEHGEITVVRIRKVGLGRNATGNLVAQDLTVNFDLQTYLRQDMWSKWTGRKKDAPPKDWGILTPAGEELTDDERKGVRWQAFPVPGGLTLWVNLQSNEARAVIGEHMNRQKFAERLAETICRRNILKRFIPVTALGEDMTVPVVGWMQDDRDLMELCKQAARAKDGVITLDDEAIEIQRATEVASDKDDIDAAIGGEVDEDMQPRADENGNGHAPEPASVAPSTPKQNGDPELTKLRSDIRDLVQQLGDKGDEILGTVGFEGLADVARTSDKATLQEAYDSLRQYRDEHAPKGTNGAQEQLIPDGDSSNFIENQ